MVAPTTVARLLDAQKGATMRDEDDPVQLATDADLPGDGDELEEFELPTLFPRLVLPPGCKVAPSEILIKRDSRRGPLIRRLDICATRWPTDLAPGTYYGVVGTGQRGGFYQGGVEPFEIGPAEKQATPAAPLESLLGQLGDRLEQRLGGRLGQLEQRLGQLEQRPAPAAGTNSERLLERVLDRAFAPQPDPLQLLNGVMGIAERGAGWTRNGGPTAPDAPLTPGDTVLAAMDKLIDGFHDVPETLAKIQALKASMLGALKPRQVKQQLATLTSAQLATWLHDAVRDEVLPKTILAPEAPAFLSEFLGLGTDKATLLSEAWQAATVLLQEGK